VGREIHTTKKSTEFLLGAKEEISVEVNAEKTMWSYIETSTQDKITT
jgi:hypothetical protein